MPRSKLSQFVRRLRSTHSFLWLLATFCLVAPLGFPAAALAEEGRDAELTLNAKDTGYRGIWYMNQPLKNEYRYKYSGGLGTYCAKHRPFAVYCPEVHKTFFCYGGSRKSSALAKKGGRESLLHMVSYYDHATGTVPRPTVLLDKKTTDAHDNPVILMDDKGYIWIFSTSHGTSRPSYLHRGQKPYSVDEFERIEPTKIEKGRPVPMTNFSYMQPWFVPGRGFLAFFTRYGYPAARTVCAMTSRDGVHWSEWQRLGAVDAGHYQTGIATEKKAGTVLNYHPGGKGLNWRTNLYYLETTDFGRTWHAADGTQLTLPLTDPQNPALVHDYENEGLLAYLKDIRYGSDGLPVLLFTTSKGFESGPKNDPRTWRTARWSGDEWVIRSAFTSDNNYDMGSLYIEDDGTWRVIGPTQTGPQPYNPGGEIAMWTSTDEGATWCMVKQLTHDSPMNHTYARHPVNAHDDFYAFWADGHGRQPSESSLYFCTKAGDVYRLPREMKGEFAQPELVK